MSRRHDRLANARGMTLLEVLLALTILALIVVVLVAALRVGVRAWEAGERRAAGHQELRAMIELLTEALSTAFPYKGRLGEGLTRTVLFEGEADEVHWVTTAPPLLLEAPAVPFHAITLRYTSEGELRLTERLVPTDEPFGDEPHVGLSRAVSAFHLEYRDEQGAWQSRWEKANNSLPRAVRVELTVREPGRGTERKAAFVVPLPLAKVS
jgi:general secretion pathway protein J